MTSNQGNQGFADILHQLVCVREDINGNGLRSDALRQERRAIAAVQVDIDRIGKPLGMRDNTRPIALTTEGAVASRDPLPIGGHAPIRTATDLELGVTFSFGQK